MPRPLRRHEAGATYHVTSRGNHRMRIFADEADRRLFLKLLREAIRRYRWRCHAYCLMTTHFHLLLTTVEPNIGRSMQWLKGSYGHYFNKRYGLKGHLFEGRFHSVDIESESQLLETLRYIALNPVRAGHCDGPEAWPWSSYRDMVGSGAGPTFLAPEVIYECFTLDESRARSLVRAFVLEGTSKT